MEAHVGVDACLISIEREEDLQPAALVAANALLASRVGHHDAAEAWFNLAIERARDIESKAALVYRSSLAMLRRGRTDCIPRLEEYAAVDSSLAAGLNATLATAYVIADRPAEAMRRAHVARDILAGQDRSIQRTRTLYQIAYVALRTGEFEEAKTFARETVESARRHNDYDIAARGFSLLYELAHHIDCDPRSALRYIEMVEICATESGDEAVRTWANMAGFYLEIEAGNVPAAHARESALKAEDIVQSVDLTSATLVPAQALRCSWRRDFAQAHRLVAESGETQPTPEFRAFRFSESALYAAASGAVEEARAAIESSEWTLTHASCNSRARIMAQAFCTLAAALAIGIESAEARVARLERMREEAPPSMNAVITAVRAVYDSWCGKPNHAELLDSFAALREHYFGGISMLLEALPVPS